MLTHSRVSIYDPGMATNLKIDTGLLQKAQDLGQHKTKRETVDAALAEYVGKRDRLRILELAGTIDYLPGEDPVSRRQRERKGRGARRVRAG